MPDTKNFHGMKNILLDNDDWLVVDPLDYDAFVYYAPEKYKNSWNQFREGDTYFVIDKDKEPIQTSIIHKTQNDGIEYYGSEVQKHRELNRFEFVSDFPDEVKNVLDNIIGVGKLYSLLVKINNGEQVSSRELENADESIYDFKYTPNAPFKSKITLGFDEDEYIKLFDISEDDLWYYDVITSYYDTYEFESDYQSIEDFQQGYIEQFFRGENLVKLKEILSIISPQSVDLDTEEKRIEVGKKLYDMFEDEIDNIISDYVAEINECKTRGFKQMIKNDFCDAFYSYDIFTKDCLTRYFTSVELLIDLYNNVGDTTLTIKELLFKIGSEMQIAGWSDYIYEIECDDFDYESLDTYVSNYLDKIMEKLEDESKYIDIYEYSELFNRLSSKYKVGGRYNTKSGTEFVYKGIDPENNRIIIQVYKKEGGLENRSYDEEEFNNFLVSPELFERFIRIN
jgi:hypothetical protein